MRWRIALVIFQKEVLETLRDRRTLAVMLLLPLVMYPLLIVSFGQLVTHQVAQIQNLPGRVAVLGALPEDLRKLMETEEKFELLPAPDPPPVPPTIKLGKPDPDRHRNPLQLPETELPDEYVKWARQLLNEDRVETILVLPEDFQAKLDAGGMSPLALFYDETNQNSRSVKSRLSDILVRWRIDLQKQRVAAKPDLPTGFSNPLLIDPTNTATPRKQGGFLASRIIPIVLIMMVLMGAFYPAIDLTAGEKERGTMQTLVTAPAMPTEIIAGKFMTVFVVAIISSVVNLISMSLAIAWMLRNSPQAKQMTFSVDWGNVGICMIQLVPVAALFAAMLLAICIFAQSFREAQNYLTPVYLLVIVWAALTMLPTVELDRLTAWVPGLNIMLLMRELLLEPPAVDLIVLVLVANFLYALIALAVAVHIFQNEQVLVGGQVNVGSVFSLRDRGLTRATPTLSMSAFAFTMLILFYIGSWVQEQNVFWGMLITQWVLILGPALLVPRIFKLSYTRTFQLRMPPWQAIVGAVLLGATGWAVVGHSVSIVQEQILPMPPDFAKRMQEALGITDGSLSHWQMIFAFALSPAICEETFFRGLVLGGFRGKLSNTAAVLVTGLLFGLFHMSIYRILPTAVLGVLITWLVFRAGSLWVGCILHFLNNAVAILASLKPNWFPGLADLSNGINPISFAVAALLFAVGIGLVWSVRPPREDTPGSAPA